jgi:hypothetical protein
MSFSDWTVQRKKNLGSRAKGFCSNKVCCQQPKQTPDRAAVSKIAVRRIAARLGLLVAAAEGTILPETKRGRVHGERGVRDGSYGSADAL